MQSIGWQEAEKEKILFLSLCSEKDAKKILNMEEMTCKDFERIHYLVTKVGLEKLSYEMHKRFELQEAELIENIVQGEPDGYPEEKAALYEEWLEEFCENIRNENLKLYYKEKFDKIR